MPVTIFFCYAREDEALLNKLKAHLKPLQRQSLIDVWYDRDISAGTEWDLFTGKEMCALTGHTGAVRSVAISPDGQRLFSGSYDHMIKVWGA